MGCVLRSLGSALGDEAKPDAATVAVGVAAALDAVSNLGKAQLGDKTLVDVLHPFAQALAAGAAQNLTVAAAWTMAAHIADEAAQATRNLMPRIGRARPHAEKSIGTPDPGAVSMALIIRAADEIVRKHCL